MQEPDSADLAVAAWIRRFLGVQDDMALASAPPEAWASVVAAATDLALELVRRTDHGWSLDSEEPWWERTNEATADPLDGLDPSIAGDLASALVIATRTLTQAAELLLGSLVEREAAASPGDADDVF